MAIDKFIPLIPKNEKIISNLPDDNSKHAKYVYEHSEEIIKEINKDLRKYDKELKRQQFYSHKEAEKVILD